ncbi:hypothetical protein Dimus_036991 [Dionaea muscipula]
MKDESKALSSESKHCPLKQKNNRKLKQLKHPQKRKPLLILWGRKPQANPSQGEVKIREEGIRLAARKDGLLHTALSLFRAVRGIASERIPYEATYTESTVPMVYLKRGGLPRIIPAHHPEMIRRYDSNADRVVKRYLSCFSLAKEMKLSLNMRIREE